MKRLLTSVVLPYIGGFIPIVLLLWWGWRHSRVVQLASKEECPKGSEPISRGGDGWFVIFGVARGTVQRYCVETLELEWESWCAPTEIRVVFSGSDGRKCGCYRKATVVVRGMYAECLWWERRVNALLRAKEDAQPIKPENPKAA